MARAQQLTEARPYGPEIRPHALSWPTIVLASMAGVKIVVGVLALVALASSDFGSSAAVIKAVVVRVLPWLPPALVLLLANGRQFPTGSLGVAMLLVISSAAALGIPFAAATSPAANLLLNLAVAVFTPYYFGRFLLEFPQPRSGPAARWLLAVTNFAGVVGIIRFVALLPGELSNVGHPWVARAIALAQARSSGGLITYGFSVLILVISLAGIRGLLPDDRRRHERLLIGWLMLIAAISVTIVSTIHSAGGTQPTDIRLLRPLLGLSTIFWVIAPSLIAYRVLEGQRWRVREVLRRAVQVALDLRVLVPLAFAPLLGVAVVAYVEQDRAVSDVFSRGTITWIVLGCAAAALLYSRRRLLKSFNRWFFREHYDAAEMLFELTGWMRKSRGIDELVAHLTSGIDRALRPYRVVVLLRDESSAQFVPLFGSAEPLPATSLLAELLAAGRGVVDAPLDAGQSPMRWLPQDERYWLVDCGARLIVPLHGSDGSLNGLITIGDRRSGRPYTEDDRRWLTALAESAMLTIEGHSALVAAGTATGAADDSWRVGLVQRHERAFECDRCGRLYEAGATGCRECGTALSTALVPRRLFGKFQFEQRIGRGGMGVVYRATDLALERPVAVKLLPSATPEYSELLRLEARNMAAVTHRHLAVVYGVEAWRGQPLLVCEFMARGTLADQLTLGPMATDDVLTLGIALSDALDVIHARHLLHRDIKPSNIGFDHTGVPKLLDFGLAQLLSATSRLPEELRPSLKVSGTPLYMSPESIAGQPPDEAVDLWSLHVLLYEAMTGRHPFRRATSTDTLHAIATEAAPPLTPVRPLAPQQSSRLAAYFAQALSRREADRPRSAAEVAAALRALIA